MTGPTVVIRSSMRRAMSTSRAGDGVDGIGGEADGGAVLADGELGAGPHAGGRPADLFDGVPVSPGQRDGGRKAEGPSPLGRSSRMIRRIAVSFSGGGPAGRPHHAVTEPQGGWSSSSSKSSDSASARVRPRFGSASRGQKAPPGRVNAPAPHRSGPGRRPQGGTIRGRHDPPAAPPLRHAADRAVLRRGNRGRGRRTGSPARPTSLRPRRGLRWCRAEPPAPSPRR